MKRVLALLLIFALIACCLLALASCTVKFGSSKSTAASSTSSSSASGSTTARGNSTAIGDGTSTQDTTGGGGEPTEPPATTAPEGLPIGEDTDNRFGPVHSF